MSSLQCCIFRPYVDYFEREKTIRSDQESLNFMLRRLTEIEVRNFKAVSKLGVVCRLF